MYFDLGTEAGKTKVVNRIMEFILDCLKVGEYIEIKNMGYPYFYLSENGKYVIRSLNPPEGHTKIEVRLMGNCVATFGIRELNNGSIIEINHV